MGGSRGKEKKRERGRRGDIYPFMAIDESAS